MFYVFFKQKFECHLQNESPLKHFDGFFLCIQIIWSITRTTMFLFHEDFCCLSPISSDGCRLNQILWLETNLSTKHTCFERPDLSVSRYRTLRKQKHFAFSVFPRIPFLDKNLNDFLFLHVEKTVHKQYSFENLYSELMGTNIQFIKSHSVLLLLQNDRFRI